MLKYVFLASALTLCAPAFAQEQPGKAMTPQTAQPGQPTTDQTAPSPGDSTAPAAAAPAQDSTATAAAQPTTTQIAEVVNKEFASYDKNGDGVLSAKEFDSWMVALKSASDPATKADAPATKAWLNQAFAQADMDKNKKVSRTELTGFLSQG